MDGKKFRVLVTDNFETEAGKNALTSHPDVEIDVRPDISAEALREMLGEYDALIIRSKTKVTAELLEKPGKLRVVCRSGVGIDNIDLEAATARGILVQNVPAGNTNAVVELTIAHLLLQARRLYTAIRDVELGNWTPSRFVGLELKGKTLGIVGLGRIGSGVARIAKAFSMRVLAYDPYRPDAWFTQHGAERVASLDALVAHADFVTIHVPRMPETMGLISADIIGLMKQGAALINAARGGIVDEAALAKAIFDGRIAGAGLDVFSKEPIGDYWKFKPTAMLISPHIGGSTEEARTAIEIETARNVITYLTEDRIINAVNAHALPPDSFDALRPERQLAEYLTAFAAQVGPRRPRTVEIAFDGFSDDEAKVLGQIIRRTILTHLEPDDRDRRRDYIAADFRLQNAFGIEVSHAVAESLPAQAGTSGSRAITLVLTTELLRFSLRGEISGDTARIAKIGDCRIDSRFGPWMLYYTNEDRPGVIARVSEVFARHEINIDSIITENVPGPHAVTLCRFNPLSAKDTPAARQLDAVERELGELAREGIINRNFSLVRIPIA